jgi:hypothetical protein
VWLGATAAGNVVRFRHDVNEHAALLGAGRVEREVTFVLPAGTPVSHSGSVVASGTPAGTELLARLRSQGMPAGLAGMGFADTTDTENGSSRRVAERLGLRLLGPTISVP